MMTDTRKLAGVQQKDNKVGYIFDLVMVYLLFGRVGRVIEWLVNLVQKPTNHTSEVERQALQMMEDRMTLMRLFAERPAYLQPGTYDDLMG